MPILYLGICRKEQDVLRPQGAAQRVVWFKTKWMMVNLYALSYFLLWLKHLKPSFFIRDVTILNSFTNTLTRK